MHSGPPFPFLARVVKAGNELSLVEDSSKEVRSGLVLVRCGGVGLMASTCSCFTFTLFYVTNVTPAFIPFMAS